MEIILNFGDDYAEKPNQIETSIGWSTFPMICAQKRYVASGVKVSYLPLNFYTSLKSKIEKRNTRWKQKFTNPRKTMKRKQKCNIERFDKKSIHVGDILYKVRGRYTDVCYLAPITCKLAEELFVDGTIYELHQKYDVWRITRMSQKYVWGKIMTKDLLENYILSISPRQRVIKYYHVDDDVNSKEEQLEMGMYHGLDNDEILAEPYYF